MTAVSGRSTAHGGQERCPSWLRSVPSDRPKRQAKVKPDGNGVYAELGMPSPIHWGPFSGLVVLADFGSPLSCVLGERSTVTKFVQSAASDLQSGARSTIGEGSSDRAPLPRAYSNRHQWSSAPCEL